MRRLARFVERLAFGAGAVLLLLVVLVYTHRLLPASVPAAVAADELPAVSGYADAAAQPDTSSWSESRIAAYRESFKQLFVDPVAELSIPDLGLEVPVFEGTSELVLNRGAGLIEGTGRIGESGTANVGIAAHRDGYFRKLKDIRGGERIEVRKGGATYHYTVTKTRIVSPENVSVLDPGDVPQLTLVTCYPFYFVGDAPERFIVTGVLDEITGQDHPSPAD